MSSIRVKLRWWLAREPLRLMRSAFLYRGKGRLCPVCGRASRRFAKHGSPPREDAQCVQCGALERHRFLWLYLQRRTDLFDGRPKRVLHLAPEKCLEPKLKAKLGAGYLTADLSSHRAMVKMDITDIQFPDKSFDVICCSHVLEHIQDDRRAMRELYRVLRTGGWAILLVPITAEKTHEDPSIVDPKERLEVFGQEDHVRRCGPDYIDRLREAGFAVDAIGVDDLVDAETAIEMGLASARGKIYFCTKQAGG